MEIERSNRGFSLVEFTDAAGCASSLQDSSLASEACCWFGVVRLPGSQASSATRMHLTTEMTRQVARAMCAALEGRAIEELEFEDRYGSTCIVTAPRSPDALVTIGVRRSFGTEGGHPMQLDRSCIEGLMPFLLGFLATGTISGEGGASELADPAERVLDVKVPASMIGRADIGETGVSAQDLIDAFLLIERYYGDDMPSSMGYDNAKRMERLAQKVKHLAGKD